MQLPAIYSLNLLLTMLAHIVYNGVLNEVPKKWEQSNQSSRRLIIFKRYTWVLLIICQGLFFRLQCMDKNTDSMIWANYVDRWAQIK